MFSGIIEHRGTVVRADRRNGGLRLVLRVPAALAGQPLGASIAVNGACLTVVESAADTLAFDAVGATLKRTLLGDLNPGNTVNLERSLRVGDSLDGHWVTGHVDGIATVRARRPGEGAVYLEFAPPEECLPQIAPRGSVAVDGVSLTVAETRGALFTVSVVPFTLAATTLGDARPGTRVHVETDVLAKYVQHGRAFGATATSRLGME